MSSPQERPTLEVRVVMMVKIWDGVVTLYVKLFLECQDQFCVSRNSKLTGHF